MRRVLVGSLRLVLLTVPVLLGCQTMSIEEAKKVTASFSGSSFVPPPRTIDDLTVLLDQQKRLDPKVVEAARVKVDQGPPETANPTVLATFHVERALAARQIGRQKQELEDWRQALLWVGRGGTTPLPSDEVFSGAALAEAIGGSVSRSLGYNRQAITAVGSNRRGALFNLYAFQARLHAQAGDLEAANAAMNRLQMLEVESRGWRNSRPTAVAYYRSHTLAARASISQANGHLAEAESLWRESNAVLLADTEASKATQIDLGYAHVAGVLLRQGRLLEAEKEARTGLLGALAKRGRYSPHTAILVRKLAQTIAEQGRFAEAETLIRVTLDIYQKSEASEDSWLMAMARTELAQALVAQGRWREALQEYETVHRAMRADPAGYEKHLAGNSGWAVALMRTGLPDEAIRVLDQALERSRRVYGGKDHMTAEVLGLRAIALAQTGDRTGALRDLKDATPILLMRSREVDDETASRPARDQRLAMILAGSIGLLADIKGTLLEGQAGLDVAAEAFRLADVARGQSVQRALDAGAARASARTPALADLVRREQDAKKQLSALAGMLANAVNVPTDQQDQKVIATLRRQIDLLRHAREALLGQLAREFPGYAELINPKPATVDAVRKALRPGEALVSMFVTHDRVFSWAVGTSGPVAFGATSLSEPALADMVRKVRKALDPGAKALGDIPEFDVVTAHRLYQAALEPVAAGWKDARSLLVVTHGALGQLPFALLPTKPTPLGPEQGLLFANYREVPWLVRTHAVTVLPSVASLATLRSMPAPDPSRRPFIGFGDPWFSPRHAARAAREEASRQVASADGLQTRGLPIALRSSPATQGVDSNQLAMLPRLPETADEIRSLALAMNADVTKEVFLGAQANEKVVKSVNLAGYRVVAFATHGLVSGDLDGLTQPALALSAPDVAGVDGDGLLTMEEILGLRLNADWVVLSACNTASASGAGSEAISGLGRAFFYAGARALLVTSWPVETRSALALTTDLFRRQHQNQRLTRAQALQETLNALIDGGVYEDERSKRAVFSYAHPLFWAPFMLVGDGGGS